MLAVMKAIRVHECGGPESLRIESVPVPAAGDGEVLVRVVAAGVLPLSDARLAHEMLAGAPHDRGKIVLTIEGTS